MSAVDSDSLQIVQPVDPSGVIDRATGAAPGQIVIPVYTKARSACAAAKADEIVVCAQDPEQHRLRPLPDRTSRRRSPGASNSTWAAA